MGKGEGRSQEVFGGKVRGWGGTGFSAGQVWGLSAGGLAAWRGRELRGNGEGHRERGGGRVRMAAEPQLRG